MAQYAETPERITLAEGFLAEAEETTSKRIAARTACASQRGEFAWMRFDVCTSRGGGTLPPGLTKITSSKDADKMFRAFMGTAHLQLQEVFAILLVDSRNQPLGFAVVATGGISSAQVEIGLVLKPAVLLPAPAILLCHNHPSGDATPSMDDVKLTERIVEAGRILGVRVLDHIVQTPTGFVSFLDVGLMPK